MSKNYGNNSSIIFTSQSEGMGEIFQSHKQLIKNIK